MSIFSPDLMATLSPSRSAAGFDLGEDFSAINSRLGPIEWHEKDSTLDQKISLNTGWMGVRSRCGLPGAPATVILSLVYMNDVICLEFEESMRLYRIDVGAGYGRGFYGVTPGDNIRNLEKVGFSILFNDMDDDFLVLKHGQILSGISFSTNYRTSLEKSPNQIIQYISIYNWSFRN